MVVYNKAKEEDESFSKNWPNSYLKNTANQALLNNTNDSDTNKSNSNSNLIKKSGSRDLEEYNELLSAYKNIIFNINGSVYLEFA